MVGDPMKVRLSDLRGLPLFHGISLLKLRRIAAFCRKRVLPKNTVMFLEDEPATHLYFVLKGSVAITTTVEGRRTTVHEVHEMGCVDWSSLVEPYLCTATAQCTQPCLVLEIDALLLRRRIARDHRLGSYIMTTVATLLHERLLETRRFYTDRLERHVEPVLAGASV